jgi:hypothetical protein
MDEETKMALLRVIHMYLTDEENHWESMGHPENHIRNDLRRLSTWLLKQ